MDEGIKNLIEDLKRGVEIGEESQEIRYDLWKDGWMSLAETVISRLSALIESDK